MKIKAEQDELDKERQDLEKTLGSKARLKKLIIAEIEEDMEKFGDDRRSPIVARSEAKAMSMTELVSSEPVTVVLSTKGWARLAKGHEIDGLTLNYKSGDEYQSSARGRSNQLAIFLDDTGRSYTLPSHSLPSARGQGEPLTGRLNPPSGALFEAVLMGSDDQACLLASDAGYGFIGKLGDMVTKNKAGKTLLKLPKGAKPVAPGLISDKDKPELKVAAVSNEGRLLIFPLLDLPEMPRGKGNKIISIPSARAADREELMIFCCVLAPGDTLIIYAGKRHLSLKSKDLEHYIGERGRRGSKLPRGYQKVDRVIIESK